MHQKKKRKEFSSPLRAAPQRASPGAKIVRGQSVERGKKESRRTVAVCVERDGARDRRPATGDRRPETGDRAITITWRPATALPAAADRRPRAPRAPTTGI
ncbi:unnamed protein product [Danaus chrysippus]|uniref:(African queen) hypothetical protein n=1 Tax=Danaus chrysippus TaxID=151541 RepID=A0A8J2Q834_9NEOP|nr:unnamed protein product [Danaus chrysippus]